MIKIENSEVVGLEHAIRGMRNPMNSWEKSDSVICSSGPDDTCCVCEDNHTERCFNGFVMGNNDHDLMMRLANGGPVHAKYRRMIAVYVDITAPLYWWKEFDTYKVGTVSNSCSTMHKIHEKEFTLEDFSHEHLDPLIPEECEIITVDEKEGQWFSLNEEGILRLIICNLNYNREFFIKTKDKKYWWQMIQLLPSSYNQKRTIMLNYEVLVGMYRDRKNHKLDEWREFCKWIESLPYSEIITGKVEKEA